MSKPTDTIELGYAGAALRAFNQIALVWGLTDHEQAAIIGRPVANANEMAETGNVDIAWPETIERVSYVVGIYRALHILFPDQRQADAWVRRPNKAPAFNGDTALALMCTGGLSDLAMVRQHLEAQGLAEPFWPT